jgi:hypothetical protein
LPNPQHLTIAHFELTDADGHSILRFWRADEQGALVRAHALVRGLCDRLGLDAGLVGVSLGTWAVSARATKVHPGEQVDADAARGLR